jgi:hypothetical protein
MGQDREEAAGEAALLREHNGRSQSYAEHSGCDDAYAK